MYELILVLCLALSCPDLEQTRSNMAEALTQLTLELYPWKVRQNFKFQHNRKIALWIKHHHNKSIFSSGLLQDLSYNMMLKMSGTQSRNIQHAKNQDIMRNPQGKNSQQINTWNLLHKPDVRTKAAISTFFPFNFGLICSFSFLSWTQILGFRPSLFCNRNVWSYCFLCFS